MLCKPLHTLLHHLRANHTDLWFIGESDPGNGIRLVVVRHHSWCQPLGEPTQLLHAGWRGSLKQSDLSRGAPRLYATEIPAEYDARRPLPGTARDAVPESSATGVVRPVGGHFIVDEQPQAVAEETLAHLRAYPM
jgi:hypothetical protein